VAKGTERNMWGLGGIGGTSEKKAKVALASKDKSQDGRTQKLLISWGKEIWAEETEKRNQTGQHLVFVWTGEQREEV